MTPDLPIAFTLNSIWGGCVWYQPLTPPKKIVKKQQMQSRWLQLLSKSFWTTYKTILETLSALGAFWPKSLKNCQILGENAKNSKNTNIIKKCRDAILDNIIIHNLAKFQLSRSFWTWVISIFVKYQKIAILRFWPFFHQNWSKFSRL